MSDEDPIYQDYLYVIDSLRQYASPKSKLTGMIKSGQIVKVRRGLYVAPGRASQVLKTLANKIYGPSYISFEYALSYYGLIPERVHAITSASLGKNKSKEFRTPVGVYTYQSISPAVFAYGVIRQEENGQPFLIAEREKALCDTLSKSGSVTSVGALERLLFEDLRIARDELLSMRISDIAFLAPMYCKKGLMVLAKYLQKEGRHA